MTNARSPSVDAPATLFDFEAESAARAAPRDTDHVARLRTRAMAHGFATLPDFELLELALGRTLPHDAVKAAAKALLVRFGGLGEVLGATQTELRTVDGIGAATALDLAISHQFAVRITRDKAARRPVISSWSALLAYAKVAMAGASREQFRVLFLDKKNQLVADEVMNEGTVDHAPVYPREVMRRALEIGASAIILAHNHPSGDPTPSDADVRMTKQVADAGRVMGVAVHDHIVVGREGVASLKALGLF